MTRRVVRKFELPTHKQSHVLMNAGAEILHLDAGFGKIFIWALVDPSEKDIAYFFKILETNQVDENMIHSSRNFIGTAVDSMHSKEYHVWLER